LICALTQSSPSIQQSTLDAYFLPNASFSHPFVRTGSFDISHIHSTLTSRYLISRIYLWYKILSPHISLSVSSATFDSSSGIAYATVNQRFAIWFIPFYKADVMLVVRLQLLQDVKSGRWYIASQDDCYPMIEAAKFLWFGLWRILWLWQAFSTLVCVLGCWACIPVTAFLDRRRVDDGGTEAAKELKEKKPS
jgi:hypothetical protein